MSVNCNKSSKFTVPFIIDPFAVLQQNCVTGNELRWLHVSVRLSPSSTVVTLVLFMFGGCKSVGRWIHNPNPNTDTHMGHQTSMHTHTYMYIHVHSQALAALLLAVTKFTLQETTVCEGLGRRLYAHPRLEPTSLSQEYCILLWGSYTGELNIRLDSKHQHGRIKNGKHSISHSPNRWHYLHSISSPCCGWVDCTIKQTPKTCPHTTFQCDYFKVCRNIKGIHAL